VGGSRFIVEAAGQAGSQEVAAKGRGKLGGAFAFTCPKDRVGWVQGPW
jgi:hypothetical protein